MKKTVVPAIAVLLCLSACGQDTAAIGNPFSDPVSSTPRPAVVTPEVSKTPEPSETPYIPEWEFNIPPEGTYVSTSENFSANYEPSVTFSEEGTFVMKENLLEGMGSYSGTYEYDGNYYECTVKEIDFSGFAGDDVKKLEFSRFDADTIILLTDLCGSNAKDVFTRARSDTVTPGDEEYTIKPKQEVGKVTGKRLYTSSSKMFSEPYQPTLEMDPDGTFELTENLFEGMGHYTGTYEIDDYRLTLNVSSVDFKGFAGDTVKKIEFEALRKDVLELRTDLCGSLTGDVFYLNP